MADETGRRSAPAPSLPMTRTMSRPKDPDDATAAHRRSRRRCACPTDLHGIRKRLVRVDGDHVPTLFRREWTSRSCCPPTAICCRGRRSFRSAWRDRAPGIRPLQDAPVTLRPNGRPVEEPLWRRKPARKPPTCASQAIGLPSSDQGSRAGDEVHDEPDREKDQNEAGREGLRESSAADRRSERRHRCDRCGNRPCGGPHHSRRFAPEAPTSGAGSLECRT